MMTIKLTADYRVRYPAGSVLTVDDEQAKVLRAMGVAEPVTEKKQSKAKQGTKKD